MDRAVWINRIATFRRPPGGVWRSTEGPPYRPVDEHLIDVSTRNALIAWVQSTDDVDVTDKLLHVAFDGRREVETAPLLLILEKRLAPHVGWLRDAAVELLELTACGLLADPQVVIERLARTDTAGRARILSELPVPNQGLPTAHRAFRSAWEVAPRAAHYRDRIHRGEPTPVLHARELVGLTLFIGETVEHFFRDGSLAEALALTRKALATEPGVGPPPSRPTLDLPGMLAYVAERYLHDSKAPDSAIRTVSRFAVPLFERPDDVQRYLRELDDELRRLDIISALGSERPSSPIASAIHRADDIWLARLENEAYGLLLKQDRRVTWVDGSRDAVLKAVPADHVALTILAAKEP